MATDLVQTRSSISALAREHGVSRSTIRRRLANGWQPPVTIEGEIIEANQQVTTPATRGRHPHGLYADAARRGWRAVGRGTVGLAVACCGVAIAVTSIRANAWFGRSLTTDENAGEIFSHLSVLAEITACIIPTANRFYWQDGDWRTAVRGFLLMAVALTVVFFAASGFALNTISTGIEARGDRVTPAVELAQRTADTLAKSRADECRSAVSAAGIWKCKSERPSPTSLPLALKFARTPTRRHKPCTSIPTPCAPYRPPQWSGCACVQGISFRSVLG
jgi:hypothetical protein